MIEIQQEPMIAVGVLSGVSSLRFAITGAFENTNGEIIKPGEYTATLINQLIEIHGATDVQATSVTLRPTEFAAARLKIYDVVIGINFHWQRNEDQTFQGALKIIQEDNALTVINELPLEDYLISVISSEMSASCPPELLRAHAIVSRSWLLAQLVNAKKFAAVNTDTVAEKPINTGQNADSIAEIIKWYDRENHAAFDVCADDHCQRYQGISKAFSAEAFAAAQATRGVVLGFAEEICDARYSKSCGGMSEVYAAAWEEKEVPYLSAVYDWQGEREGLAMPLCDEANATAWIQALPKAFCHTASKELLARILPGFDQETLDFYRWRVRYSQAEIQELLRSRVGLEVGAILALEAIERGASGRIIKLKITGTKRTVVIGKELEIRRALSPSHLYSSAFIVETEQGEGDTMPQSFTLVGAGWGHGVGLCQIGAAVMADSGFTHEQILAHYFTGAELRLLY